MTCARCGQQLPAGAAFCFACGTAQAPTACTTCGTDLVPGAAFCLRCGTPVPGGVPATTAAPVDAQRRLTSVLFADLVSYTTLSESRDSEDVRALLSEYFDVCSTVVRRYGGTVEKFIGDAVMAVWGVPAAHEDDAERAVRAGLELVSSVAELGERLGIPALALRAGIVTGEVAANLAATDQGMVAGDPVNTAARVQAAAAPGEVWVDAPTRSLTSAAVTYTDVGEHLLKGKAEPVRLHRAGAVIAAVGGLQRVDGLEAPLSGRARELRLLKELFHATEESGRPQLVLLDGEAGVGKSRLGWEFEKYVDGLSRRVAWHRGRCLSYGEGVAFWALSEAVRARVGLVEDDAGAIVIDGLDRVLAEQVGDETERAWLRPRVASLLGEESREFAREDLFAAWTRFFERVGAGDPVVLLVEDAQYADAGLLDFVEFLLGNAHAGVFVLLVARPELLAGRPDLGGRRATPIRVEPLPDAAMATLLDGLVEGLPDDVRAELVERADGIPLYAVETVRALIDRDVVVPDEGRYVVAPGRTIDLASVGAPASLQALIAARLDALAPAERRVLNDASVLGETFTRDGIGILSADVADLDEVLAALARRELIATERDRFSAERGQYRFVQSVVRQVAYGTLSRRDRKARHLLVAEHLATETERAEELAQVIARHLLDAAGSSAPGDPDVPELRRRAGDLLVRAATRASALGAFEDAARLHTAALECLQEPAERARVLHLQSLVEFAVGRYADARQTALESVRIFDELDDPVAAADSAYTVTRALSRLDELDEVYAYAHERHARIAGLPGADRVRGRLASAMATALFWSGRTDEADAPLREALAVSDLVDDFELFRTCCNVLAMGLARRGSIRVSLIVLDGLTAVAREREDWVSLTLALGNSAARRSLSDLGLAISLTEEALGAALDHGMTPDEGLVGNLLNYWWIHGQWDDLLTGLDAEARRETELTLADDTAAGIAALLRWAGRPVDYHRRARPDAESTATYQMARHYANGAEALVRGDLATAVAELSESVRKELELNGPTDDLQVFWPVALRAADAVGDDTALTRVAACHEEVLATQPRMTACYGHALVARSLLALRSADADPASVEADLHAAAAILDACGAVVWAAHAREDLGRLLLGQGRGEEGRALLDAARTTYDELGATAWAERLAGVVTG